MTVVENDVVVLIISVAASVVEAHGVRKRSSTGRSLLLDIAIAPRALSAKLVQRLRRVETIRPVCMSVGAGLDALLVGHSVHTAVHSRHAAREVRGNPTKRTAVGSTRRHQSGIVAVGEDTIAEDWRNRVVGVLGSSKGRKPQLGHIGTSRLVVRECARGLLDYLLLLLLLLMDASTSARALTVVMLGDGRTWTQTDALVVELVAGEDIIVIWKRVTFPSGSGTRTFLGVEVGALEVAIPGDAVGTVALSLTGKGIDIISLLANNAAVGLFEGRMELNRGHRPGLRRIEARTVVIVHIVGLLELVLILVIECSALHALGDAIRKSHEISYRLVFLHRDEALMELGLGAEDNAAIVGVVAVLTLNAAMAVRTKVKVDATGLLDSSGGRHRGGVHIKGGRSIAS